MATRQKKAPLPLKAPLRVVTIKVTPAEEAILQRLSRDASDNLGWTVSSSAIIRALIQHAGQQPESWAVSAIHPPIGREITAGRVWGYIKKPH